RRVFDLLPGSCLTVCPLAMTTARPAHVWTLQWCAGRDAHRLAAVMASYLKMEDV
ncbi:hypothetical protein M9458_033346, partial [Cirrhinus mrigala]